MIRAKDLLLLRSQAPANTKKSHKKKDKDRRIRNFQTLPTGFPLYSFTYFPPSYLCELLAAAEFLTEGVELCRDLLVGPSQLSG